MEDDEQVTPETALVILAMCLHALHLAYRCRKIIRDLQACDSRSSFQ